MLFFVTDQEVCSSKELFVLQTFLADHDEDPGMIAYDRPSPKMLSFLSKHYGEDPVPLRQLSLQKPSTPERCPHRIDGKLDRHYFLAAVSPRSGMFLNPADLKMWSLSAGLTEQLWQGNHFVVFQPLLSETARRGNANFGGCD